MRSLSKPGLMGSNGAAVNAFGADVNQEPQLGHSSTPSGSIKYPIAIRITLASVRRSAPASPDAVLPDAATLRNASAAATA